MLDRSPRSARRPTLNDVAALAGVSLGTVSNVLNRPDLVSPNTRTLVERAIAELGFARNAVATALARGDTRTIGLVVVGLSNSLFVDIARGAQGGARAGGRYLQLAMAEDDSALLEEHMSVMTGLRISGLLVAPMADPSDAVRRARKQGSPVVLVNYDAPNLLGCRVLIDNEQVGWLAARHMVEIGRRRIAFIGSDDRLQPIALRRRGIRRALAKVGSAQLEEFDAPTLDPIGGRIVARELAARPADQRPDAIIAVSDLLAVAVISELRSFGLRVPEDVAVMGCDHNSAAWGGAVPLTSVTMEGTAMGAEGVQLLMRELSEPPDQHVHSTVTLEPTLLVRESTVGRAE